MKPIYVYFYVDRDVDGEAFYFADYRLEKGGSKVEYSSPQFSELLYMLSKDINKKKYKVIPSFSKVPEDKNIFPLNFFEQEKITKMVNERFGLYKKVYISMIYDKGKKIYLANIIDLVEKQDFEVKARGEIELAYKIRNIMPKNQGIIPCFDEVKPGEEVTKANVVSLGGIKSIKEAIKLVFFNRCDVFVAKSTINGKDRYWATFESSIEHGLSKDTISANDLGEFIMNIITCLPKKVFPFIVIDRRPININKVEFSDWVYFESKKSRVGRDDSSFHLISLKLRKKIQLNIIERHYSEDKDIEKGKLNSFIKKM